MCLSTAFPQHCNHTYAAVRCCVVFLLWELFTLLWDHMDRLKEETHGTDSQPGSRHRFISSQLMVIKQRLCARQWVGTDQSSSLSALKIFSAHNVLKASGYRWVEYFCINEVFPDTPLSWSDSLILLSPGYAQPVSQGEWETQWIHSWKSQRPKAQDCGQLAPQMGHQGDGYIANGSDSQIVGTNNAWVFLAFPMRITWKRMPA